MGRRKQTSANGAETDQQPPAGSETVSGYFRSVLGENPQWLKGRSNEAVLQRWRADHPGEELTNRIKQGLQNVKSILRSRGRERGPQKRGAEAAPAETSPA